MARMQNKKKRVEISEEVNIVEAASEAMIFAQIAGFTLVGQHMVATAVSELARNIYLYAMKGEVTIRVLERETNKGIEIVAEDNGPGIADIGAAMKDHFSTSDGLGLGLPGVKRLMDEFRINTKPGVGTKITVRKWV